MSKKIFHAVLGVIVAGVCVLIAYFHVRDFIRRAGRAVKKLLTPRQDSNGAVR